MKKTYLIDSENVNDVWVELLKTLDDEDEILVFYTEKSAHMGYDKIVCLMEQERGEIHWIKCYEGQNALDFQLVTELGWCLAQNGKCEYVIVSNDTGYDPVIHYWKKKGYHVRRMKGTECEHSTSEKPKKSQEAEELHSKAASYLKQILNQSNVKLPDDQIARIIKILVEKPKKGLGDIHTEFLRQLGHEEGIRLYAVLRKHIKIIQEL